MKLGRSFTAPSEAQVPWEDWVGHKRSHGPMRSPHPQKHLKESISFPEVGMRCDRFVGPITSEVVL
jgi:hypothetical protein